MPDPEDQTEAPPSRISLSRTPSWIMLGFLAGALFVWQLDKTREPAPEPPTVTPMVRPPAPTPLPPEPMAIEAVFSAYEEYAVWQNDRTEVVLLNPGTGTVIDRFEVLRVGDQYYFRTIPALTRPYLDHGVPDNLPIRFTETAESRQRWLQDVADENRRSFTQGIINVLGGGRTAPEESTAPNGGE